MSLFPGRSTIVCGAVKWSCTRPSFALHAVDNEYKTGMGTRDCASMNPNVQVWSRVKVCTGCDETCICLAKLATEYWITLTLQV